MINYAVSVLLSQIKVSLLALSVSVALAAQVPSATFLVLPENISPWDGYMMLKKVAACESTGSVENEPRQFNSDGSILWGQEMQDGKVVIVKRDCGILQINTIAHKDEIDKLNLNVCTSESDNLEYGKILYQREGLKPWFPSKKCWSGAK